MANRWHLGAVIGREGQWDLPGPVEVLFAPPYWLFLVGLSAFLYVIQRSTILWVYDLIEKYHTYVLGIAFLLVVMGSALYVWSFFSKILFIINIVVLFVEICSIWMTFGVLLLPLGPVMLLQIFFFFYGLRKDPFNTLVPIRMGAVPKFVIQTGFLLGTAHFLINVWHVI